MTPYEQGHAAGVLRSEDDTYDVRWEMADHAKAGTLAEFRRGFEDGFDGKDATP